MIESSFMLIMLAKGVKIGPLRVEAQCPEGLGKLFGEGPAGRLKL